MGKEDFLEASTNIEKAKLVGFRDGFLGSPARNISPYHEPMAAYLHSLLEGRKHREQVDEVASKEDLSVNEVMKKAFDFYYEQNYNK